MANVQWLIYYRSAVDGRWRLYPHDSFAFVSSRHEEVDRAVVDCFTAGRADRIRIAEIDMHEDGGPALAVECETLTDWRCRRGAFTTASRRDEDINE